LSGLLERDSNFNNLQREIVLGRETRYRADVLVNRSCGDSSETLLIECKTYLAQFSISSVIGQLEKYKSAYGDCRKILAVPTSLKPEELATLAASDIEVWDLEYIASHFSMQIDEAPPSYYKALFLTQMLRPDGATHEQKLMKSLASCSPGKAECYVYQALVGEILECLFTPTLGKPIQELADESEANRRDFIMPNYSEKGFWLFMREKYEADYVVIDAKNYTQKVKKSEILQIANYLKPHGAGLFGIIVSRKGGDSNGCEHTLREQWLIHRKLILVLDDDDITSMLMAKSDGRQAEDILGQKIEQFRLSM